MPRLSIVVGDGYIPDLAERLEKYGISPAELAREMGKSPAEVSRWFNSKKRFGKQWTPRMENIQKIEEAIINLRRSKARRPSPARGTVKQG